ncbi:MAG: endolytic transglycosylase MltG [Demequinaceae bacterium]|nr:endolytic transglycosylase MltG [Demequinaceae bacterium]
MTDLFEIEAPTTTTSLELRRLQRDARRHQRRIRTLIASAIALVVFALGASIAWNFLQAFKSADGTVADYTGYGQGQVQIIINVGDDGLAVGKTLQENGVVASVDAFWNACLAKPGAFEKVQPGYYVLPKEMKAEYALSALLDRDRKIEKNITIVEGKTVEWILDKVASITGYSIEEVQAVAADVEALGLPEEAGGNLEGWLFPSTYSFDPDVHPQDVLAKMVQTTVTVLERNGIPREDWQETLIIASLIEREAGSDADRPLVSSVIQNRLSRGMHLEFCSTIRYFLPGGLSVTTAETQTKNPYNTYLNAGLPPGPIASPGEASIKAAYEPAESNYLFFVTVNPVTGETRFAATLPEHNANKALYKQWCTDNGGC